MGFVRRSFIPLLSSFAAIPGVMAAAHHHALAEGSRSDHHDRAAHDLGQLPVYALSSGAFIAGARGVGSLNLQGLVRSAYVAGVVSAMAVAWMFKRLRLARAIAPRHAGVAGLSLAQR